MQPPVNDAVAGLSLIAAKSVIIERRHTGWTNTGSH